MAQYINPFTDFGFKKLFGEEASKDLLIDFLNQLLPSRHQIRDLQFGNTERLPQTRADRKAIFDLYCISSSNEQFIVEMQKAPIHFFKDRSLFYSTFPIQEQAKIGIWDFQLSPVYFIAILDFIYDTEEDKRKFRRDISLKDQDGDLFFDKLHFRFLQMPLFTKTEFELETHFDKWVYFLKNLPTFNHIPEILNEPIFKEGFRLAEVSNLSLEQKNEYNASLKTYLDLINVVKTGYDNGLNYGREEGRKEGREEGKKEGRVEGKEEGKYNKTVEIILNMHQFRLSPQIIASSTGLPIEQVNEIIKL